jgi:hypothetical protein
MLGGSAGERLACRFIVSLRCNEALKKLFKTSQSLIVSAIRERQKIKCSSNQSYPQIEIRDRSSPHKQKFDLLAVIIWHRHKLAPARLGRAPAQHPNADDS